MTYIYSHSKFPTRPTTRAELVQFALSIQLQKSCKKCRYLSKPDIKMEGNKSEKRALSGLNVVVPI